MTDTANDIPPKEDSLGLQTISDSGTVPRSRLSDPAKARDMALKIIDQNRGRSYKNGLLKGQLDGNKPFSPVKLKAAGQAWRTNVNFREAKGSLSAGLTPFYDLFTGGKHYLRIDTYYGDNAMDRNRFSQAITEEADCYVKEWDGFDFNMQAMLHDFVAYGKGFLKWPTSKTDWKFDWINHCLVFVPDNTKAHGAKVPVLVIREDLLVHELWGQVNSKKAAEAGWNVEACKRAIKAACQPRRGETSANDFEAIQQRLKDNDVAEGFEADKVIIVHLFVTEFSGRISHFIVPEKDLPTDGRADLKPVPFLYESTGEHDSMRQVLAWFFFEIGDGSWNGSNGMAMDVYDAYELSNRLMCGTVDGAFVRSSIMMQAMDANAIGKLSLIQMGAFSVIPPGFNVQQSTVMGDLQGPLTVKRQIDSTLAQNTGIYRPKMDKPEGNPRTAEEVRLNFQASATLSTSAVNRFYSQLDQCYKELVRRLVRDREFVKRCEKRGIPEEALKDLKVVAHRAVGNGSAFMRQNAQREMGPLVSMMPESGRMEWARDTAASVMSQDAAERYFPNPGEDASVTDHAAYAVLENGLLASGAPVMWTPSQNNSIHCQTHLEFAAQAAASLQQGGNAVEVLNTLDQIGQHSLLHIQKLQGDETRKTEVKVFTEEWKRLAKIADELRQEILRAQQQQAKQQAEQAAKQQEAERVQSGADPDTVIKMAKAQQDMTIKGAKAAQQLKQKSEAHNLKSTLADAKTAATLSQMKAKADMQAEAAEQQQQAHAE